MFQYVYTISVVCNICQKPAQSHARYDQTRAADQAYLNRQCAEARRLARRDKFTIMNDQIGMNLGFHICPSCSLELAPKFNAVLGKIKSVKKVKSNISSKKSSK
jgi:hypothetical protein